MTNLFNTFRPYAAAGESAHWIYAELDSSIPLVINPIRSHTMGMVLCTSGYLDLEIDFRHYRLSSCGMLCFTHDHILRMTKVSGDFKAYCILIDDLLWKEIWREMERLVPFYTAAKEMPVITIDDKQAKMLLHYLEIIKEKYHTAPTSFNGIIEKKIFSALIYEIRLLYAQAWVHLPVPDKKEKILQQFLLLVTKHFRKERRIEFYAAFFKLTPKYLSSVVRQKSALTAGEWIDHYIVTELCILLRTTNRSVKEIADELNFPDQSFLGKYFKRHLGVSPKEYRKQRD